MYKLTWTKTGDSFEVEPIHHDFSAWFVERCRFYNSKFTTGVYATDFESESADHIIQQTQADIDIVNQLLPRFQLPVLKINNWFDQQQLNQLHKDWVASVDTVAKVLFNINREAYDAFNRINRQLHRIERMFVYKMRSVDSWRENNPFVGHDFPTGVFNVNILYADHGRSSMEKFINFDDEPNDAELSNWKCVGSAIEIILSRPYRTEHPKAFLDYCTEHRIQPVDTKLPFGNLVDCKNRMSTTRQIMNRNFILDNNYLTFE
jgi:hypothetical protein